MADKEADLSAAIVLFLANYPGSNEQQFKARFPEESVEEEVRKILLETNKIHIEWGQKTLNDIGDEVEEIMRSRHPELTEAALRDLSNYFTYLVR